MKRAWRWYVRVERDVKVFIGPKKPVSCKTVHDNTYSVWNFSNGSETRTLCVKGFAVFFGFTPKADGVPHKMFLACHPIKETK